MTSTSKSNHQRLVETFMRLAKQDVPGKPQVPSEDVRLLRAKLIFEEALETIEALGVSISALSATLQPQVDTPQYSFRVFQKPDMVKVVDGCCDLKVVTTGTLSAFGICDEAVQRAVDESNLQKFGPGSYLRDDGKWIKPPDWEPPDLQRILNEQAQHPGYS